MRLPESILAGGPWAGAALVQVTLVAVLGWLAWFAARRGGPALRGAALLATLAGLLVAPALAAVAPVWLPLPDCVCPAADGADPGAGQASRLPPVAAPVLFTIQATPPPGTALPNPESPTRPVGEPDPPSAKAEPVVLKLTMIPEDAPARAAGEPTSPPWSLASVLTALWLLGALACLGRALVRLALLYYWARQARPARERDGVDGTVALRESPVVTSPLTLGLFCPVILVPPGWRDWPAGQREWAMRHELAHVRRRDFLAGLVAELAVCLCWFHPLVRWLAGRLRLEQEYAADAWVASALNDSTDYVRCLARLALGRGRGSLAPAFWRRRPEILRRIDMLRRNPHGHSPRLGRRAVWTVTVLAAAACLAVAGVGPLHSAANGQPAAQSERQAPGRATADTQGDPLPAGALARLGTTRLRHDGDVTFVFFGADGKTLLTAGRDNTIRLWDLATGKEIRRFAKPSPAAPKMPAPGGKMNARDAAKVQFMPAGPVGGGGFCVALSADGKTLAAAGGNVVQFWEVETGKALHQIRMAEGKMSGPAPKVGVASSPLQFPPQAGGLAALLFSPDGRTLAGRLSNGGLLVWEADTGKEIRHIKPAPPPAGNRLVAIRRGAADTPGMAFTQDGKALAAAMTDYEKETAVHSIKIWDIATGKETQRVKTPEGVPLSAVAVAPGGKLLAYGGRNLVHLCDAETGKELHQLTAPDGGVRTLVFSRDGKTLAVRGNGQRVRLWESATGKELRLLGDAATNEPAIFAQAFIVGALAIPPETRAVALSPDGARIASASGNTVRLWEAATGKELPLPGGHHRAPTALAVSPDGKTMVSWGTDRVVRRWEAATGQSLGTFPAPPGTTLATFSADGQLIALANADGSVRVHETATGKQRHRFGGTKGGPVRLNAVAGLTFSPDGRILAVRGGDNSVRLYDLPRGGEPRVISLRSGDAPGPGRPIVLGIPAQGAGPGLAFSPDGKLLVVPASTGNALVVVDVAAGKELRKIDLPQAVSSFVFAPDGRTLAAENADRTVTLWEVAGGKERARFGQAALNRPAFDPRARQLVVAATRARNFADPAGPVGVTFSPDGRALAVRGPDKSVRVWDVAAGKEIGQLKGHAGRVETVAFAPDGKALVSGAADTTILVWDAAGPLRGLSRPRPVELSAAQLETLWGDLAAEHGGKALRGVHVLADCPGQAVPFLADRLKPAPRLDPEKLKGWIADLESAKYAVRQGAAASLLKAGDQALPALRKVLASSPALETRQRVEALVDRLITGALTAEQLRVVRAVEALERMGTPEARRLLRALAEGGPGALPTREAEAALGRLAAAQP